MCQYVHVKRPLGRRRQCRLVRLWLRTSTWRSWQTSQPNGKFTCPYWRRFLLWPPNFNVERHYYIVPGGIITIKRACKFRRVEIVGRKRVEGKSVARTQGASWKLVPQCASTSDFRTIFFDIWCGQQCAWMCHMLILAHSGTTFFKSNLSIKMERQKRQGIMILGIVKNWKFHKVQLFEQGPMK